MRRGAAERSENGDAERMAQPRRWERRVDLSLVRRLRRLYNSSNNDREAARTEALIVRHWGRR
jgi:hypothetical protein